MPSETVKFEAQKLTRAYGHGQRKKLAVNDVSFRIFDEEIVSVVGESGCGKTVLARMLLRLERPTSGSLFGRVQAFFADPFAAFNQFFTIRAQRKSSFNLFETKPSPREMEERVDEALLNVNIKPREVDGKYPFELSGGQMQRMLLARIFILRPKVLIADEPTSMVDACSRASILDYLLKLKQQLSMTIVFITHDIGLAYYVSNRLFIMHEGQIVEQGPPEDVTERPQSAVTRRLLEDIPDVHRDWLERHPPA